MSCCASEISIQFRKAQSEETVKSASCRKTTAKLRMHPLDQTSYNTCMYTLDVSTGETVFALTPSSGAQEVVLEGFSDRGRLRVSMQYESTGWVARIALAPGWFFYRFSIDGRTRHDRAVGKLKSSDGQSWSLALINGISCAPSKTTTAYAI